MRWLIMIAVWLFGSVLALSWQNAPPRQTDAVTVLRPARVFDGDTMHEGWAVRVTTPGTDRPFEAVTNAWGAALFDRLAFDDLAGARVELRRPADPAARTA